ncbi:hypothetical protein N0V88_007867 [Collariella sp. IMI 366227]|nr:hypothetical protein N0V88_007867 [Collariella sp. IMI 366227]
MGKPRGQFLTWISKGTNSGTPGYYELPSQSLNPLATKNELSTVINNMVTRDTLQGLIKDEFRVANVIEARPGLQGNSYAKLYSEKYAEFLIQVDDAINKLPAGENKRNALQVYQTARDLSGGIIGLRRGATMGKLYDELTRIFPDKHPSSYYTYVENGVTKRRDPIKWVSVRKSFGSYTWLELDLLATKQANLATYTAIEPEITKRIMMFEADDINTVTWNYKFPRSNRNHNAVIFHMNEMRLKQPGWKAC